MQTLKINDQTKFFLDEDIDRREVPALKVHPMVLGQDGVDLFAAGVADMDFKAPPVVIEALQKRLDHGVFGYETLPDNLLPALRNWLDKHHQWQVKQEHILRSPNILNTLAMAASCFTNEGDGIIVQPPVFFDFFDIIRENHRNIINNPLVLKNGRYSMDFDDLEQKASDPRTKMMYLCNPHNPVGRVWDGQELLALGDICQRHNVLVVADEMHGDIVLSGYKYTPFASLSPSHKANCITCLSPAKTFNIAACCSAFTIIANDKTREIFQAENSRLTVNKNNAFANIAMQAAFQDGEPWLQAVLSYIQDNIDLVRTRLEKISSVELIEPEATFLLWLDFTGLGLQPEQLTKFLREEAHWAITRGQSFGREGSGFARLNIACTRAKLVDALDRLESAVEKQNKQ